MQREPPCDDPAATTRRADLAATLQPYTEGLRAAAEGLSAIADVQRRHFQQKEGKDVEAESADEDEAPVHLDPQQLRPWVPEPVPPRAFFSPCDQWRRPSDFLAYQVKRFEAGDTAPPGKPKEAWRLDLAAGA